MRGATGVTIQPRQILRLPRKNGPLQDFQRKISKKQVKTSIFQCGGRSDHDPSMIREWKTQNRKPALASEVYFCEVPQKHFSIVKIQRFLHPILQSNFHQILRLPRKVTLQLHQVLRLPRKSATWTSPKYCTCHEKWLDCFIVLTYETSFPMRGATGVTIQPRQILRLPRKNDTARCQRKISKKQVKTSFPMRGRSDHDPTMIREWKTQTATRLASEVTLRGPQKHFSIVKYNVLHPILQSNFHQILRLPRKVTLQLHQVLRLLRKSATWNVHHQVLHLPRKVTLETSPSSAPATKKWHLNFTKYCACHFTKYGRRLYLTLLDTTLLDSTLLDSTLLGHYSTWTLLYLTLLYSTLLYLTLLYLTLLYSDTTPTWLYSTWLYSTRHYSTWLNTWLYSTWHYSTWKLLYLDSTLLDTTLLDLTLLRCRFVYRKFSELKLPLMILSICLHVP